METKGIEQSIAFIGSQGVLGALVIIFGGVILFLYRENKQVNKEYLEFVKQTTTSITQPLQKLQDTSDKIEEGISGLNQVLNRLLSK